jgi:hypothetical protein
MHYCYFIIPLGNMLFPLLTAEWLHPVLYFSTEYHNSRLIILIWKYLLDIRSEAWQNFFWEYINGKLFGVLYWRIDGGKEAPCCVDLCIHPIQSNPLPIHSSPPPSSHYLHGVKISLPNHRKPSVEIVTNEEPVTHSKSQ